MTVTEELRDRKTTWLLVAPVTNLTLTSAVDHEYQIDQVTLVSASNLPYRRRRLGFPERISELRTQGHGLLQDFFSDEETFALVRRTGEVDALKTDMLNLVREELELLALSQLGYAKRWNIAPVSLSEERPQARRRCLFLVSINGGWTNPYQKIGGVLPLVLDDRWRTGTEELYFGNYLAIIRGEGALSKGWRQDLRNAGILAGQSQKMIDIPQAFLWNMIAIELLLTTQDDKQGDALPERAEAFLGWVGFWELEDYEAKIRAVYQKRCLLVHRGDRGSIEIEDLYFTDDLLWNLLVNVVRHIDIFKSKEDVVGFSERLKAKRLLGAKGTPKDVDCVAAAIH